LDTAVRTVRDALASGDLAETDLTARRVGAFLGKTTSVLYHHWGSLDGFLFAVAQDGYVLLSRVLGDASTRGLTATAEAFIGFGMDQPVLYRLMFERVWDWDALRAAGAFTDAPGLVLWARVTDALAAAGSEHPAVDALLLHASLHGLVSLANSGRANVGDLSITDREAALGAARALVSRLCAVPALPLLPEKTR